PVTSVGEVHIGLLGLGTVGAGVVKILQSQRAMLEERAGCRLALAAVADTDLTRAREGLDLRALPMTNDAARVLGDPGVHVVIELVGGLEPARTFILRALAAGKHVVTANKALLAHHGAELYEEARRRGVTLAFEAAVAGGIPLIRAVKEGLAANSILSLAGIVNGTCNYILSKMTDEGIDFSLVLKEAQAQGYAEADPTLDIEGMDSAHKLQILVSLAFRTFIDLKDIHPEGITRVTAADIAYARDMAQDKPGVLSRVAGILGENDISIANVIQKGRGTREAIPVVIVTHEARERDMRAALTKIDRLRDVAGATTMIRVEGGPA